MKGIGEFLKRFADFTPPVKSIQRAVAAAIRETFKVEVSENDVSVRDNVAFIAASGALKSEIVLRREELLKRLEETHGKPLVRDIR